MARIPNESQCSSVNTHQYQWQPKEASMGTSFRPVRETWGVHSSTFVKPFELESILEELGEVAFCGNVDTLDYGEVRSVAFEEGQKLIDYLTEKTTDELVAVLIDVFDEESPLRSLITNLKGMCVSFQDLLGSDGELTFYIDAY
jgi:hypothetical protein